jgi:tRNA threonylcarbamoyladenosine biosynthesis protein TsaE
MTAEEAAEVVIPEGREPYKESSAQKATFVLVSGSPSETFRIGRILGERLRRGDCVALTGELGAGKTCLTQGIAKGMGVPDCYAVTSPTFTLVNEYPGRDASLYHVDVYRLAGSPDLLEMGYEEYLLGSGVMVIEWAEKILRDIPEDALRIRISYLDEDERKIEISGGPERIDFRELYLTKGGC